MSRVERTLATFSGLCPDGTEEARAFWHRLEQNNLRHAVHSGLARSLNIVHTELDTPPPVPPSIHRIPIPIQVVWPHQLPE
jgi:hypothetical protein